MPTATARLSSMIGERTAAARAARGERAKLAHPLPAREEVLVELHELHRRGQGLLLVPQLEDRVAADHLLGLDERAVDDTELPVLDAHLRARGGWQEAAAVKHAAGRDLPVGELVHRLQERRRRRPGVGGPDYEHKAHLRTPSEASRGRHRAGGWFWFVDLISETVQRRSVNCGRVGRHSKAIDDRIGSEADVILVRRFHANF